MKYSKYLIIIGSTLFIAINSIAIFAASTVNHDFAKLHKIAQSNKSITNNVSLLFIQQAGFAYFKPDANKKGCYQLTLSNIHKNIIYFSDQPQRITGKISISQFLMMWKHDNKTYHTTPNVAIQAFVHRKNGTLEINDVSALSNPRYNSKTHSLSYTACSLKKNTILAGPVLRDINLFFDPFHRWPP